jgi:DNA-nicking Smr family endonuclease
VVNFGDILREWEKRTGTRKNGEDPVYPSGEYGAYDKDAEAGEERPFAAESRRRLRLKRPDASIDIHGMTKDEASAALGDFFRDALWRGHKKVLVIHGKGNHSKGEAVLKKLTREFIEGCPFAGESGHENASGGGSGATWVLLKSGPGKLFTVPGR